MKLQPESKKELTRIACGTAICTAVMWVIFEMCIRDREYPVKMVFGTVADALKRAGITLEGDDYTEPALDQLVSAGSTITVHRVDYTDRVETQAITYDTEYVYTSLYFRNTGRATTVRHGAEGQQTITTRDRYVDGELENSIVVDSTTTVEPTNHVIKTLSLIHI